jgi:hypothetical protein
VPFPPSPTRTGATMPVTAEQSAPPVERRSDGPPFYVITLSTWVTDRKEAFDLAVKVTESMANAGEQVDRHGTTIGLEDDNVFGQERIYEHMEF